MVQSATMQYQTTTQEDTLTVLYDGACPLCRREIAIYRDLKALAPVSFADVSDAATDLTEPAQPHGVTPAPSRAQLLARFHVRHADGRLSSGAAAFVELWARMPGWRWLARVARLPGVTPVLEWGYRGFLRLRPRMQRWAANWDAARR